MVGYKGQDEYYKGGNSNSNHLFKQNCKSGFGVLYHKNGQILYVGTFKDGYPEGTDLKIMNKEGQIVYKGDVINGFAILNGYRLKYPYLQDKIYGTFNI